MQFTFDCHWQFHAAMLGLQIFQEVVFETVITNQTYTLKNIYIR